MGKSPLSAATRRDMERMLRSGSAYRAIAYECGVSATSVYRVAKTLGMTTTRSASPRLDRAAELVAQGMSIKKAAKAVGLSYAAVREGCFRRSVKSTHPCWQDYRRMFHMKHGRSPLSPEAT